MGVRAHQGRLPGDELLSPEVCSLSDEMDVWSATTAEPGFDLYGTSPGVCVIEASFVGLDVTATLELDVIESP